MATSGSSPPLEPVDQIRVRGFMGEKDGHYFASREEDERAMSREAPNDAAAAAHSEMADRYEALAAVFGAKSLEEMPSDYPKAGEVDLSRLDE